MAAVELSTRYITSRFLPDKAIDLVDEAASRLRLEMNSVPEEIDTLDRRVRQLEIRASAVLHTTSLTYFSSLTSPTRGIMISGATVQSGCLACTFNAA